jgi:hypothetical protein
MKKIVIPVPKDTKAKLDVMRTRGFTITGFVRRVLAQALRDVKIPRRAA